MKLGKLAILLLFFVFQSSWAVMSCEGYIRLITDPGHFHWNNFSNWLQGKHYTLLDGAPAESQSFTRQGVALEGQFRPKLSRSLVSGKAMANPTGKVQKFGGQKYIEFPNSTALSTIDPVTKEERVFIMTRGVRPYSTEVNVVNGSMGPQGYVSDVLLFEQQGSDYHYISTILKSEPEFNFKFEDPRVSFFVDESGKQRYFLSGTDYSPHVPDSNSPDIMNRYVELQLNERGVPQAVEMNSKNKDHLFRNLGPAPEKQADGYAFVDAKNGTIYPNEYGEIVVRSRMRPDFGVESVKELFGDDQWHYGEQVFIFKNFEEFQNYDWQYALRDLAGKSDNLERVRPRQADIILRDSELREMYKSSKVIAEKGKGFGPGAIPVRVRRHKDVIYLSDCKGAKEFAIGQIGSGDSSFILKEGEVKYLSFDHEIRYFADEQGGSSFVKRHYSSTVKLFDDRISHIEAYYADVIQPREIHELGLNSGIVDLQHVYPMGRVITDEHKVRVFAGASDAHTTVYDFDIMTLLEEMSYNSAQRASGQVYEIR